MADDRGQKPVVHTKKHVARLERERRQVKFIKYAFFGLLIFTVGMLLYGYLDANFFQLQKPVAKVGETEISRKDFQIRVRIERAGMINNYMQYSQFAQMFGMDMSAQLDQIQAQLDDPQTLGNGVIDSMINEELIRQEAAKRGITVTDAELDAAVQDAYQFYPAGSPPPPSPSPRRSTRRSRTTSTTTSPPRPRSRRPPRRRPPSNPPPPSSRPARPPAAPQ